MHNEWSPQRAWLASIVYHGTNLKAVGIQAIHYTEQNFACFQLFYQHFIQFIIRKH